MGFVGPVEDMEDEQESEMTHVTCRVADLNIGVSVKLKILLQD